MNICKINMELSVWQNYIFCYELSSFSSLCIVHIYNKMHCFINERKNNKCKQFQSKFRQVIEVEFYKQSNCFVDGILLNIS